MLSHLSETSKKINARIKQKLRLGEVKRAARNVKNIDASFATLQNQIEDLKSYISSERTRLFEDMDAILKYKLKKLESLLATQPLYIGNNKFILIRHADMDLVIPSEEAGLISYITRHGVDFIEPGTRSVITRRLAPGDVAVDVGANCGIHSIDMARAVGTDGAVYAFEPAPSMVAALKYTALLSGFRHMHIIAKAVIDKGEPETIDLYSIGHSPENSIFPVFDAEESLVQSTPVETCSLDGFFPPGSRVDLVKMDVEGAEPLVFAGMQRVIRENKQIKLVMELSPSHFRRSGLDLNSFLSVVKNYGFEIFAIDESNGFLESIDHSGIMERQTLNVLLKR